MSKTPQQMQTKQSSDEKKVEHDVVAEYDAAIANINENFANLEAKFEEIKSVLDALSEKFTVEPVVSVADENLEKRVAAIEAKLRHM